MKAWIRTDSWDSRRPDVITLELELPNCAAARDLAAGDYVNVTPENLLQLLQRKVKEKTQ